MTETRELICINCPLGCGLTVTLEDKEAALHQEGLTATVQQRYRQNTTRSNTAQGILSNLATLPRIFGGRSVQNWTR